MGRRLSGIVALIYIAIGLVAGGWQGALSMAALSLMALTIIWHSEALGDYAGFARGLPVRRSPGCVVAALGWALLLAPIVLWIVELIAKLVGP